MLERPENRAFVTQLLSDADLLLLDYSHSGAFPPFALAVLAMRESVTLQLISGSFLVGGVVLWERRGDSIQSMIAGNGDENEGRTLVRIHSATPEVIAHQHPNW